MNAIDTLNRAGYIKPGYSRVSVLSSPVHSPLAIPGTGTVQWLKETEEGIIVLVVMDDASLPPALRGNRVSQTAHIDDISLIPDGADVRYA